MIIDMPNTRTREIAHKIEQLHEERGESATGRVLTLLIATEDADLEHALEIANSASREHPCRVIAVVPDTNPADQSGEGEPNAAEVAAEVSASRDNPARFDRRPERSERFQPERPSAIRRGRRCR